MRIALFHELHAGGARRSVNEIAKELKKHHTVDLYVVDDKRKEDETINFSNVYFYRFLPKLWKGGNWKTRFYKDTFELYNLYDLHKQIAKDINHKDYDIVVIHPSKFTQAPFILRFIKNFKYYYCQEPLRILYDPVFNQINNMHGVKRLYEKANRSIRKYVDRNNLVKANIILANSKHSQANIKNAYGVDSIVNYLGVDTTIFKPQNGKKDIDILYIGAKEESEGFFLLEDALKLIKRKPKVYTHITGKDWIADDKQFVQLYNRAKVIVCLAKKEPFGLIPIEAMACGVPVIAVNEGGYTETVVNDETGFLIARDSKELAKKIDYLLANKDLQKNMGQKARQHVITNWTWQQTVKSFEKIIKNNFPGLH